jgi:hypothetical protein
MAKKQPLSCKRGQKRFTVVQVDANPYDSFAARSFEQALRMATPNRGSWLRVYVVCAKDAGEARLPSAYAKRGRMTQLKRYKRG